MCDPTCAFDGFIMRFSLNLKPRRLVTILLVHRFGRTIAKLSIQISNVNCVLNVCNAVGNHLL